MSASHSPEALPAPEDPFTAAVLRLMPRFRTMARLRLAPQLRVIASSADIAQSACRELLAQRGLLEFRGDAALAALVRVIVVRKIREKMRRETAARRDARRVAAVPDLETLPASSGREPVEEAIRSEEGQRIAFCLERLSPPDAEAIVLRHVLGLGQEEIASHLGLTLAAVRNLLHRARRRLAATLRRNGIEPE